MGCSPSKGKLFSKPGPQNDLAEAPQECDCRPTDEENKCLKTEPNELSPHAEEHITSKPVWVPSHITDHQKAGETTPSDGNVVLQDSMNGVLQQQKTKRTEKKKKKAKRRSGDEQKKSSIVQTKVDFPPHMVRAHQAAYAYLNPNISKFETLLGLLDQAAQTQLSLQPMMSALVLRFEEINQALEEMAEEGELMLKEHGDYMALSSGMLCPVLPGKANSETVCPPELPPDLLQQLLQHSTEKMRHVGGSFQALGDKTLEDGVEYFMSLSKLLVDRMRAKQWAERRIAHVLARVEGATMRKSNPEDSALHSEDSGIGGENESLTGYEKHRRHRGSAGSGSCGSGVHIQGVFDNPTSNSLNYNEYDEDEDDNEDNIDDDDNRPGRKRSNSSPPDPSQTFQYLQAKQMQDVTSAAKRPLTAASMSNSEVLSASTCVITVMELQKSKKDLEEQMKKIQGNKDLVGPYYNRYRAGLRRHSFSGAGGVHKGPLKTNQMGMLPALALQTPKQPSVRRLINTFSQGVDGRSGQTLANVPPRIRRPKRGGVLFNNEGAEINNGNNNNNSWHDVRDDLDVDNLPPPPPEVLMDNSFQETEVMSVNDNTSQKVLVQGLPIFNQKHRLSHRLRSSVQNVEVLPNRVSMKPRAISVLPVQAIRQDAQDIEQQESVLDPDLEKMNCLYQQAQKIIHLHHATESVDKRHSPLQSHEFYEGEMSFSPTVTAPPVSRVRLPPSCPSVHHRFPSPPIYRPPPSSSQPSSHPSSPRTVIQATDNTVEEIVPSVSFRDARSVFCRYESHSSTSSRGRMFTRGTETSNRRTQSEQRPSMTSHSEGSKDGHTGSTQATWGKDVTPHSRAL